MEQEKEKPLRRGWTTGACATAAVKAAYTALLTGAFPDPVTISLPKGETPSFPLATREARKDFAQAGIIMEFTRGFCFQDISVVFKPIRQGAQAAVVILFEDSRIIAKPDKAAL